MKQKKQKQYECFFCHQFYDYFLPQYAFQARFSDFSGEIQIMFYRQFGDAVLGCPAQKFVEMKDKAA